MSCCFVACRCIMDWTECVLYHDSHVEAITPQCDGIYLITCIKQLNIAHINGIWEVLRVR